jgi:hypothetical protein
LITVENSIALGYGSGGILVISFLGDPAAVADFIAEALAVLPLPSRVP